jgi:hypothetical protein
MKHVPIRPARNMIEEQVFARRWEALMKPSRLPYESSMIARILIGYPYEINQRVASVLASLICWLGTNVGKSFLDTGRQIRENVPLIRFPYLAAWGECNARIFGMNSRARQIEFLTRTQDDMDRDVFQEVSVKDLEALDQLCIWLGREEGKLFISSCEEEIERRKELEALVFHSAAGRGDSPKVRKIVDKYAIQN